MSTKIGEAAETARPLPNISPLDVQTKPYLTIEEAAILTGLSAWSIRFRYRRGDLRAAKIGNRVVIEKRDLVAFIEKSKQGVATGEYPCIVKRREKAAEAKKARAKKI